MQKIWQFIYESLKAKETVILLVVVDSQGSSPGKPGFKMAVNSSWKLFGSIGGGKIEYELAELAKQMIYNKEKNIKLIRRVHRENADANLNSGMICSGEQTVAVIPLCSEDKAVISSFMNANRMQTDENFCIDISQNGIYFSEIEGKINGHVFSELENGWNYLEPIVLQKTLYIVGGGHVGLALSLVMHSLGFYIIVLDDRNDVSTMQKNTFADEKIIIDYNDVDKYVVPGNNSYVVIMTAKHSDDLLVLEKLISKTFGYLGLMASLAKKAKFFDLLRTSGISEGVLEKVYSPIGIKIGSKTPEEIAISIAAEIIQVYSKNSHILNKLNLLLQ